jgi:hypothetical protein
LFSSSTATASSVLTPPNAIPYIPLQSISTTVSHSSKRRKRANCRPYFPGSRLRGSLSSLGQHHHHRPGTDRVIGLQPSQNVVTQDLQTRRIELARHFSPASVLLTRGSSDLTIIPPHPQQRRKRRARQDGVQYRSKSAFVLLCTPMSMLPGPRPATALKVPLLPSPCLAQPLSCAIHRSPPGCTSLASRLGGGRAQAGRQAADCDCVDVVRHVLFLCPVCACPFPK